jgi:hypothetical protein
MTVKSFLFCGVSDAREFGLTHSTGREKGEMPTMPQSLDSLIVLVERKERGGGEGER